MNIAKIYGFETSLEKSLGYELKIFSIIDAALAAENMVLAAEKLGLGSVFRKCTGKYKGYRGVEASERSDAHKSPLHRLSKGRTACKA